MTIRFYDLVDKNGNRYSNYGWRVRMALLHKGLEAEVELCCHSDPKLKFSGQNLVPVLVHNGRVVCDSWKIACYLDDTFPDRPALMQGPQGRAVARFVNLWTNIAIDPLLVRSLYIDIFNSLHPDADAPRFRRIREERLGTTLDALRSNREEDFSELNRAIKPLNLLLTEQPFIAGEVPAYADYIVFGTLQLPRFLNGIEPLSSEQEAILNWQVEMQRRFDAMSRLVGSTL